MNGDSLTLRTSICGALTLLLMLVQAAVSHADPTRPAQPPSMTIAKDGKPMATIIVSSDSDEVARAVKDLQLYIEKMSGAKLPIANSAETPGNLILVGRMPLVDELIPDLDEYDLGPDGVVIKLLPGKLILTGKSGGYIHEDLGRFRGPTDCGTPNAVYYFLESLGCRWYMPGEDGEVVPRKPTITISAVDVISKPDFSGRWIGIWTRKGKGYEDFLLWRARNRISHNTYFHMHSMTGFTDRYARTHPEYAALVKGKRQEGGAAQFCMSNPEVAEVVSKEIMGIMTRYRPWMRSYALGQADSSGWCECEKCQAFYGEKTITYMHGQGMSTEPVPNAANGYLKFVNAVAERVEKVNPNALFVHYALYNLPGFPKVKPRDNVLPIMCGIQRYDKDWVRQVLKWEKISKQLYFYGWMGHYGALPKLDFADDIRWCYEHKGIAMYLEHGEYSPMNMLPLYLAAVTMWDTETDSKKVLAEFYREYYGAAAKPMQLFYETFDAAAPHEDPDTPLTYPASLSPEVTARCRGYLTEASSLAREPVVKRRVETMSAYWRATELQVTAQHAMAVLEKNETSEDHKVAKQAVRETIDYVNSVLDRFNIRGRLRILSTWRQEVDLDEASVLMTLPTRWSFKRDPSDLGIKEKWFAKGDDPSWVEISTSKDWTSQGHDYHGAAWYGTSFTLPADVAKGTKLALYFGAVDGYTDIFLDGVKIGEQKKDVSLMWDKPFTIPLPADIDQGKDHHLVLRVDKDRMAAGIWRPVRIIKTGLR